jgi:hypothetical protein
VACRQAGARGRPVTHRPLWLLPLAALVACSDPWVDNFGVAETEGDESCDGLDPTHCLFPFPSDYFRTTVDGASRIRFFEGSLPVVAGQNIDPKLFNENDGFPIIPPIYLALPGASLTGTPRFDAIDVSLTKESRTIVLDAQTGELVPHYAEWDHFGLEGGAKKTPVHVMALRLAKRLAYQSRYIVAVHSLVKEDGSPVEAPAAFASLRDRKASTVRGVHGRRAHFEAKVFPALEKAGIDRKSLQLAWDFTTGSEEAATHAMLEMRDAMFDLVGADGPAYEITKVEQNPHPSIALSITGVAQVPSFLEGDESTLRPIRRDSAGKPVAQGFESVSFQLQFPKRLVESASERWPVLQYGHGLLGTKDQANRDWIRTQADEFGYVIVAIDYQGMSSHDAETTWSSVLTSDFASLPLLAEKAHQGTINALAIVRMLKGRFLRDADPRYTRGGTPLIDGENFFYYGNSQGGTQGTVVMSLHTDVTRGVLGVPGCAYSFLLTRAGLFTTDYLPVIQEMLGDPLDFVAFMGLVQLGFNTLEPLHYAPHIAGNPFPKTPDHRVLLQVAKEDSQVGNEVSWLLARATNATLLTPSPRPVWGLASSAEPVTTNATAFYDFGLPENDRPNYPVFVDTTHGDLRSVVPARRQIDLFLRTGESKHFCDGVCDPD